MWAAYASNLEELGMSDMPSSAERRREPMRMAEQSLGPGRMRAAEERAAAMTLATAAEFAILLTVMHQQSPQTPPGQEKLSPRERELIILVARGSTDAQIAAQLRISVRTVSSHLDRVQDKTGCRRRADLTRLALSAGLV
jgi:DNA-binding NarL/FixJ family response regulator